MRRDALNMSNERDFQSDDIRDKGISQNRGTVKICDPVGFLERRQLYSPI